ncbi:MAG: energy-coupling factor transporter transmembrane protein EcfT [Christensenellaceae bacterium]|nr:energy-coupling factor transporter transmembrane protein EcfT [Christensenellaceae bacterium]
MQRAFGGYHPLVNFIFYIAAIGLGMFLIHPAFVALSAVLSVVYYLLLNRGRGWGFIIAMIGFAAAVAFINPIFNIKGVTVLFRLFGRNYTLEALYYGLALGAMFFSIMMWFSCYNKMMTSDKFIYLFGRLIPALSLLLSMVLRLVPMFTKRIRTAGGVRECIGKSARRGVLSDKLKNSMDVLSVMMSWSLEGAVTTGDSMRSRGYGSGRRTNFLKYRFTVRDYTVLVLLIVFLAGMIALMAMGVAEVSYIPAVEIRGIDAKTIIALVCYGGILSIPTGIHVWEEISWQISRSKI